MDTINELKRINIVKTEIEDFRKKNNLSMQDVRILNLDTGITRKYDEEYRKENNLSKEQAMENIKKE